MSQPTYKVSNSQKELVMTRQMCMAMKTKRMQDQEKTSAISVTLATLAEA